MTPREPTAEECTLESEIEPGRFAIWYPQMGGYVGRAVVEPGAEDDCFDVWIWHDGKFPFSDEYGDRSPAHLHHCEAEQFIDFGESVRKMQTQSSNASR